ncbi:MAG: KpsF/GutQ family sugar-phosphate isomerase [Bacteroidales bacterium]
MKTKEEIISIGVHVIENELYELKNLINYIDCNFAEVVNLLANNTGNVIVSGIGKSAIIGQKIVATLNSTGTTAVFMHAADAIHGDLGIIRDNDVLIVLSKSGETPEIKVLVPLIKSRGNKLIAIVGNTESYLALQADYVLDTTIGKEACTNNLAPTTSTTAQLMMGDALAVSLLEVRGFTADDFARIHPGGSLGRQLYLRVEDLYKRNEKPVVQISDDLSRVIIEISTKRLGATAVMDGEIFAGIITDGDLRRMLMKNPRIDQIKAADIMTMNPKSIDDQSLVVEALGIMRQFNITQLPVMHQGEYSGVIHLHDILKEGIL